MGCVSSKQAVSITPAFDFSGRLASARITEAIDVGDKGSTFAKPHLSCATKDADGVMNGCHAKEVVDKDYDEVNGGVRCFGRNSVIGESVRANDSLSFRLRNLQKYIEGEQVAAGWPSWLSAVASEAIQGWFPLKADSYEKLEKIGQGTYSSVFRARELQTGRIVALKKVRFDNFEPESVRFMAREILILRRLDHPNVMKLDGLITSRLSCSIYLVFEYMEHDITGLLSSPDIKFSEAQIKCYMKQLLSGLEHCHLNGVMHRDIKGSNLLVNNEGQLKVADFGLANFYSSSRRAPLTSRVVTLWYRPPELLLGSTDYGASVDLWSVGCVFAEVFLGKPLLQGRTEVEQLHKIFKLCGSPADDYWKKAKLPHATIFKPQHPYENCLRDSLKNLPTAAADLISSLLSVEPYKRGTASSALASPYFKSEPHACDPASLPRYPPSKEIDAKYREDAKRSKGTGRSRGADTRKAAGKAGASFKLPPTEDVVNRIQCAGNNVAKHKIRDAKLGGDAKKASMDHLEDIAHMKNGSQMDISFSGPLQVTSSSGFAWARRRKESLVRSRSRSSSKSDLGNGVEFGVASKDTNLSKGDNGNVISRDCNNSRGNASYEDSKNAQHKQWVKLEHPDSYDSSDDYHSRDLSWVLYQRDENDSKRSNLGFQDQADKVDFSGPLLSQSHRIEEFLQRQERHIRQVVRRSWFHKGKRHGK